MAIDYASLLPLRIERRPQPPDRAVLAAALPQAQRLTLLRRQLDAANHRLADADAELLRRAEWALGQQTLAESRTQWAYALEQELRQLQQIVATERTQFAEREAEWTASAESLQQRIVSGEEALRIAREHFEQELGEREGSLTRSEQVRAQLASELARAQAAYAEISTSTFWRATQPLRQLAHALKQIGASLRFRIARARTLPPRLLRSLKLRGVKGTLTRIGAEFDTTPPVASTAILPAEAPFEIFEVPRAAKPVVSVVIPVYNKFDYTLRCLRALAALPDRTPWEAIVIDDGSSDETWERLQQIKGIRAERNPQNLGFIGASNRGVALARGTHILFLNNDTAIQPGAIDQLMATFRQHPDAGLVGAKLVYPDGRLQECGGIIFNDGSGWNYGRFGDPAQCEYQYVREVDYCSGAAILIPRALLDQLGGGFDPLYTPAYYEDTDLAFKVRGAGKRVYVQPAAVVVHYEGVSSGTDVTQGTKRYQVINQQKFLDRWREVLATHPAPGTRIEHARSHRCRHRVLFIDATIPAPDQDSGSVRVINLLHVLQSLGAEVSFLTENRAWFEGYTPALQQMGVEALYHPYVADVPQWFAAHAERFDTFILSRHYVAVQYLALIRQHAPQAKVVFDTVDLHYLREQRAAALAGDSSLARAAEQTRAQELKLIADCDLSWVVSPAEQDLLASDAPGRPVAVVSNIYPVVGCRASFAERADLIFVGGFQHTPNVDAMRWFVAEVWPRVAEKLPDCLLNIVGSKMPSEIAALAGPRVIVHGYVPSVEPLIDRARINLAPLRYGAGVKGKINSALAHGLPTVATTLAVEGMHLTDGETVLIADTPEAMAAAIVRLYRDRALWEKLSAAGLAHVEAHYSLGAARRQVADSLGWKNEDIGTGVTA
jgi:GT2 family glycosyltransferase